MYTRPLANTDSLQASGAEIPNHPTPANRAGKTKNTLSKANVLRSSASLGCDPYGEFLNLKGRYAELYSVRKFLEITIK